MEMSTSVPVKLYISKDPEKMNNPKDIIKNILNKPINLYLHNLVSQHLQNEIKYLSKYKKIANENKIESNLNIKQAL